MIPLIHFLFLYILANPIYSATLSYNDLHGGLSGLHWSDWDGRQVCRPSAFFLPETESEVVEIVQTVSRTKGKLKVVGAGHSFSSIALGDTGETMMSLDRMRRVLNVTNTTVTVEGGMRLFELNTFLHNHNLSLVNMGATSEQSVAGVTSTGTHGTGVGLGSMSTQIVSFRIVTATGEIRDVSQHSESNEDRDLFTAGRVGLGCLGVITQITFRVVPLFRLRLSTISIELNELISQLDELLRMYPRLQWYYFPFSETTPNATLLIREETTDPITGCWDVSTLKKSPSSLTLPGKIVSTCVDVSYKALTGSRDHYKSRNLYTEMEMFVPVERSLDAVKEFLVLQNKLASYHKVNTSVFTGLRYVNEDNIWMSPQYNRSTAVFSSIVEGVSPEQTGDPEEFALWAHALENLTSTKYAGVPHWGKMNYAASKDLKRIYPKFEDFLKLRESLDPSDMFLNDYLRQRFYG